MLPTYQIYGLSVRSEVPLSAPVSARADADLEIRWGEPCDVLREPPPGRVMATWSFDGQPRYTHSRSDDGYILRFHGLCEFRVSHHQRRVRVHLQHGADPGWAEVFLTGNVLAFLLTVAGECVLHASAVDVGGRALALVGGSGFGKSTLAALCCAEGAALVTDDLLRLAADAGDWRCATGSNHVRLRRHPGVGHGFPGVPGCETADGRVSLELPRPTRTSQLRAVVVPLLSRTYTSPALTQLGPSDALFQLLAHPRVQGVPGGEIQRSQFAAAARLVRDVPVYEARLPWASPPERELAHALMELLERRPAMAVVGT